MAHKPELIVRDRVITKLQASFGYDYDQATKLYDIMKVRQFETLFGTAFGAFAVWKMLPIQRELSAAHPLFRKAWMKYPLLVSSFAFAYHCATMLPVKLFNKFSRKYNGIDHENASQEPDLVGRFRVFDKVAEAQGDDEPTSTEAELLDYLSIHARDPLTKPEIVNHLMKKIEKEDKISEKFRIKRQGKDKNDIYYSFGKIHGLENIAFVPEDKLRETKGNPVLIQDLINQVKPEDVPGFASYEEVVEERQKSLSAYKDDIDKMSLQPSDRKKLLALPFYIAKRTEAPEPQIGQVELELYEELYGRPWYFKYGEIMDDEEKITEFNYENFIPAEVLARYDTNSDSFKEMIRIMNINSKTQMEQHEADKEEFKKMMPALAMLNADEKRSFIHLLKNELNKRVTPG